MLAVPEATSRVGVNKIEVLSNRLVPGSDGSIEHVVIANNAVTVIRSTSYKGRPKVVRNNLSIGGVSCKVLVSGLRARVQTVRHLVAGEMRVQGAIFVPKHKGDDVKEVQSIVIGSPKAVVQHLIDQHCEAPNTPNLAFVARELDRLFLPFDKMS